MLSQEDIDRIVNNSFAALDMRSQPENLYQPIGYMLGMGGKRIRPRLCLTTYSLFDDNIGNNAIYPAIALEIFHEFTLIHDDIMDNSDTRRNQPTVHRKWGENRAILSGDVMSILAYRFLAECSPERLPAALELFTDTAVKVCEGQQYDMDYEDMPFIVLDDYMSMIGLKTGVLIACAAKMGAVLAGASAQMCDALYNYGYQLGLAFQITDDYLDTFGNEKIFGKKIGGDIMNGKKTWLLVNCFKMASGESRKELERLMSLPDECREEKVAGMQELYTRLGVKAAAQKAILEYHGRAMSALDGVGLDAAQLACLSNFAEQLIHREK
jgi:Geranylgeranyl pyrophosphate synthase